MNKSVDGKLVPLTDKEIAEFNLANKIWLETAYDRALKRLREKRNQLLAQTDWRMTTDYPYSDQAEWASYRTSLRNLPATAEPTLDESGELIVDWPTAPDQS